MSSTAQAAVLSAAITSSVIEPTPLHRRQSAPLRVMMKRRREPLDLNATVFRYLIDRRGGIQPVQEIAVPFCKCCGSMTR
ncbi:MAG TPA: hypothetical protein VFT12_08595 [Thermoanaerobaculia bacterium]|nr:hypothetical protein [Thermoanaerobaculia bacterium]